MCGYVTRKTKMTNINLVLAAIEASMPGIKLGRLTRDDNGKVVPSGGALANGAFHPKGKPVTLKRGTEAATCQIFFDSQVFNGESNGLGLKWESNGTWTFVAYDGDLHGKFGQAISGGEASMLYNQKEVQVKLQELGYDVQTVRPAPNGQSVITVAETTIDLELA